ncbi:hypothetical protein M1843_17630 [Isoptericola sp. 4D.3]|uniref:Beta-ketoacyl synthase-like protein n=1 Tax=Isoptericola peretonis TaxID=2918523 RepID=A0ABT0J7W3_9MICO|nr:hypothetical protein [Isoptericola sp. 4D.3]
MSARAVVLPGTALLVPGAGGGTDRLGEVRRAVGDALDGLLASLGPGPQEDGALAVLAPAPRGASGRSGRLRPRLAGAGIADRWLPDVAGWPATPAPAAHVPASVALLALGAALVRAGRGGARSGVVVVEVAGCGPTPPEALAMLRRANGIVVAGGAGPGAPGAEAPGSPTGDPAVARALDAAAAPGAWAWRLTSVPGGHEHLPPSYTVGEGRAAG